MPVVNGGYCTRISSEKEGKTLKKLLLKTYPHLNETQVVVRPLLNNEKIIFERDFLVNTKNKGIHFTECNWGIIYPGNKDLFEKMHVTLNKAEKALGTLTAKGFINNIVDGDLSDAMRIVGKYYPTTTAKNKIEIEKTLKKLGKLVSA